MTIQSTLQTHLIQVVNDNPGTNKELSLFRFLLRNINNYVDQSIRRIIYPSVIFLFFLSFEISGFGKEKIRVLIWDEQQTEQKKAYDDFLGETLAKHLQKNEKFEIISTNLDAENHGIGAPTIEMVDVIIWWGHRRHLGVSVSESKPIIDRLKKGKVSLIALHSAHWSTPFMEAMNEKTREIARERFQIPDDMVENISPPGRIAPYASSALTPFYLAYRRGRTATEIQVNLPNCCFPAWRADGKPSTIKRGSMSHPITHGIPSNFEITKTEMYSEPFHVPEPDAIIFEEYWEAGEWFRSGMLWNVGEGEVFYFRPGHETYPVFKENLPLKIIDNAVLYLGTNARNKKANLPPSHFQRENLVAWCIVPFDSKKRTPSERAKMLKKLGINRVAYDWRVEHIPTFEKEILEYKENNIEFFAFWDVHPKAMELFRKYELKPQIWKTAPSPKGSSQSAKISASVERLLPLVELTRKEGLKLGLYNHGGWGGQPENLVAVSSYLKENYRADHVGIVYNFHHAHDRIEDFHSNLQMMAPHLLCLNLNGMNEIARPKILEIGSGKYEKLMIEQIIHSEYSGPIGIIDHQSTKDTEIVLNKNLSGLDSILKKIIGKKASGLQ